MFNPKLSLTLLTALLGLTALALPRTEFDTERAARRRVAIRNLLALEEQTRLNHRLIAGEAWDFNTLCAVFQSDWNRCHLLKDLQGVSPDVLREYEQEFQFIFHAYSQSRIWTRPAAERCQSESQLWFFVRDINDLRAELGLPRGEQWMMLARLAAEEEAYRRAREAERPNIPFPNLSVHQEHVRPVQW